jgi:plasmid stabilization system protein ParE
MEETERLQVKISKEFVLDLDDIYQFGTETFGVLLSKNYEKEIWHLVEGLTHNYLLFPECRHLPTKSKMYRWIVLESHLIIYRITKVKVHVLKILHARRSISKIRQTRSVKL